VRDLRTFHYAVVRVVPDLDRDEAVNIGLVVLADDGSFADARFADLSRVRRTSPRADLRPIALFEDAVRESLPVARHQIRLERARTELSIEQLTDWSREFGGVVRVTTPRVMLGESGAALTDRLYDDLIAPRRSERQHRTRVFTRGDLVEELDNEVRSWNISDELVGRGRHVRGRRADHLVDRTFQRPDHSLAAIVQAISFEASDLADIYGARAALIVASEDLRDDATAPLSAYAIYADAPTERAEVVRESASLFNVKKIVPVDHRDLAPLRQELSGLLIPDARSTAGSH